MRVLVLWPQGLDGYSLCRQTDRLVRAGVPGAQIDIHEVTTDTASAIASVPWPLVEYVVILFLCPMHRTEAEAWMINLARAFPPEIRKKPVAHVTDVFESSPLLEARRRRWHQVDVITVLTSASEAANFAASFREGYDSLAPVDDIS